MGIVRTFNAELILRFMDSMWDAISEDGVEVYRPNVWDEVWIVIDDACLIRLHQHLSHTWEGHIFCLKDHRENAAAYGNKGLAWIRENIPSMKRLEVNIPVLYTTVIDFCSTLGFEQEGCRKGAYLKNGESVDMIMMGLDVWQQQSR